MLSLTGAGLTVAAVAIFVITLTLVVRTHHLTRTEPLVRQVQVDPPARRVRCATCDTAWQAATGTAGSRRRSDRRPA